ncbi:type II toxin-antitoxin system PemK/MazF family toxin [Brevundimonas sp.]|uniref:type II toxin-antitoxin system PemK/MazF family toxin n=1 Tax=Brevundimonas sp. TaxID=1871086 RepID=UPI002D529CA4|nr:type II toxin-antitoxin system PemK/MazF family toxin [Brevundimonas sp.]HYC67978.1 type II toxin-antitoxin system PemK/MazF family toxin [Brevundimonas sp.]
MPGFSAGDVVKVPFPYTDREVRQRRPALVVSATPLGDDGRLYWVLMITSAEHRRWPGDVALGRRYGEAGLPSPSLIRTAKIATVEAVRMEALGRLPDAFMETVRAELDQVLERAT